MTTVGLRKTAFATSIVVDSTETVETEMATGEVPEQCDRQVHC